MKELINHADGMTLLVQAIQRAGSAAEYARKLGVSRSFISQMIATNRNITGKVAADLGLKLVYAYELTRVKDSPKQEQYVKSREEWLKQNGIDPHSREGIRGYGTKEED